MNQNFRKTLISAAVAALLSSPAWAGSDTPQNTSDAASTQSGQLNDASSQTGVRSGRDAESPSGMSRSDKGGSMDGDARTGVWSADEASRAGASDSPLYSRTPEDINGMEVIGANGEDIGKIKHVVLGSDRQNVYAVIASGGFLGLGEREFLVPLDELKVVGDSKVQLGFTKDAIKSRPEYDSAQYRELESNRPISEFSAFEPTSGRPDSSPDTTSSSRTRDASQQPAGVGSPRSEQSTDGSSQMGSRPGDDAKSPMGAARSEAGRAKSSDARMGAKPGDAGSRERISENPLYSRTPDDLSGMEVVGSDGKEIGKITNVVAGSDRDGVHVVISSGGILGIGSREVLVPLDELQVAGDNKVRVGFTKDTIESRPEYESEGYGELESNRPISEFSAFEPNKGRTDPAAKERAPGQRY